jgi:dynein intermediate chain 1, axonemal
MQTSSGVMCGDFHASECSLVCVGMYDGAVAVYDMRSKSALPLYLSTPKTGKHTDPVWQVSIDLSPQLVFHAIFVRVV